MPSPAIGKQSIHEADSWCVRNATRASVNKTEWWSCPREIQSANQRVTCLGSGRIHPWNDSLSIECTRADLNILCSICWCLDYHFIIQRGDMESASIRGSDRCYVEISRSIKWMLFLKINEHNGVKYRHPRSIGSDHMSWWPLRVMVVLALI